MRGRNPAPASDCVPCPNCGTTILLSLCNKEWCPTCGYRFCCSDNACLKQISDDLWQAHQEILLTHYHAESAVEVPHKHHKKKH